MNQVMEGLVAAIASDEGKHIPKSHFGEAKQFVLVRISADTAVPLEVIPNPHAADDGGSGAHHHHGGDPDKGAGIGRILGQKGVQVMVSRAFGPNIKRMRQRFVPVRVQVEEVDGAVALLQAHWDEVRSQWLAGEGRTHLVLRPGD